MSVKNFITVLFLLVFILFGCKKKYPKDGHYILERTIDGVTQKIEGRMQQGSDNEFFFFFTDEEIGNYGIPFQKSGSKVSSAFAIAGGSGVGAITFVYTGEIKYSYYHFIINGTFKEIRSHWSTWHFGQFKIYRKRF